MKAITLYPEWAWAIAALAEFPNGKRCENRSWAPSPKQLRPGDRLAIHAGASIGGGGSKENQLEAIAAVRRMASRAGFVIEGGMHAAILRSAPLGHGVLFSAMQAMNVSGRIVAVVTYDGADMEQRTAWDVPGLHHWRLSDVRRVEAGPVIRGRQGLWDLPDDYPIGSA